MRKTETLSLRDRYVSDCDTSHPPLAIDLDGTLVSTDLLWEAFFALFYRSPIQALVALGSLFYGKAAFKAAVAKRQPIDARTLPYCEAVVALGREARSSGRLVILATAADQLHAREIASYLGFFTGIIASDGVVNLSGRRKAKVLQEAFPKGFDYVGNSSVDMKIWACANEAFSVGSQRLVRTAQRLGFELTVVPTAHLRRDWRQLLKIARPSQWAKNLLVFAPAMLGHAIADPTVLLSSVIAFFAFSFCASATYILNDLSDVAADRKHPHKRHRPLAAGNVSPQHAIALACLLFLSGMMLASMNGAMFVLGILGYILATSIYSIWLKPVVLADVLALCFFYVYRVFLGGIATGIVLSHWLLVFCGFFFLSLALAKRYTELLIRGDSIVEDQRRSYALSDAPILASLGTSCGVAAALVLSLYVRGETAVESYRTPEILWIWVPLVLYWIARVWILSARVKMTDDPLLFALKDRVSYVLAAGLLAAFFAAK